MMFKFTPRLFDIISEMIRELMNKFVPMNVKLCVMQYVVAVWTVTSSVHLSRNRNLILLWLDEQIAKAPVEIKAHLEKVRPDVLAFQLKNCRYRKELGSNVSEIKDISKRMAIG